LPDGVSHSDVHDRVLLLRIRVRLVFQREQGAEMSCLDVDTWMCTCLEQWALELKESEHDEITANTTAESDESANDTGAQDIHDGQREMCAA